MPSPHSSDMQFSRNLLDTFIRASLIAVLVYSCYIVFQPFLTMMIWAVILGITLYPLHNLIKSRLFNHDGGTAALVIILSIAVLLVPVYFLGASLTDSVQLAIATVKSGSVQIPAPPQTVAQWPLVGKPLYSFWASSVTDLTGMLQKLAPHLKSFTLGFLSKLASVGLGFLIFIGSLMIAGIIMAFGENGQRSALLISNRIIGESRGESFISLCAATVRAVALGVIGIAFIQMLVIGIGFVVMGIPGAGLLAMGVLLLGIMQLPLSLLTVPVIAFVLFTQGATASTIIFTIYIGIGGLLDNILKPLLFGRGVDVPMPVILIGALGGMLCGGIIGLFIGPVVLAVGYKLFWQWVAMPALASTTATAEPSQDKP